MDRIKFEGRTKVFLSISIVIGFTLIGLGIGLLLDSITPITIIGSGFGIISMVVFLARIKYYEIENQPESQA